MCCFVLFCFFFVNRDFVRSREPWFSMILREMRKKYLIRREPWFWLSLLLFAIVIINITWPWQDNHPSSCFCSFFFLLRAEQEADGWKRHLTRLCFGRNFSNIISYVSLCQKKPLFFSWSMKCRFYFQWIVKGPIYFPATRGAIQPSLVPHMRLREHPRVLWT